MSVHFLSSPMRQYETRVSDALFKGAAVAGVIASISEPDYLFQGILLGSCAGGLMQIAVDPLNVQKDIKIISATALVVATAAIGSVAQYFNAG